MDMQPVALPAELRPLRHQVEVRVQCSRPQRSAARLCEPWGRSSGSQQAGRVIAAWLCHNDGEIALMPRKALPLHSRGSWCRHDACSAAAVLLCCCSCGCRALLPLPSRCCAAAACTPHPLLSQQAYTTARIQNFALHFASRLNVPLTREQVELATQEVLGALAAAQEPMQMLPQPNLRLVLRHDCL